eukprot:2439733-Pyramimonas_sp.AAC.1
MQECFWLRRLSPQAWTQIPPAPDAHIWDSEGLNDRVRTACLSMGPDAAPTVIFGDARGGPDTADPRLKRAAL